MPVSSFKVKFSHVYLSLYTYAQFYHDLVAPYGVPD